MTVLIHKCSRPVAGDPQSSRILIIALAAPIVASILSALSLITTGLFFSHDTSAGIGMGIAFLWTSYMTIINWQLYATQGPVTRGPVASVDKGKEDWPFAQAGSETREAKKIR